MSKPDFSGRVTQRNDLKPLYLIIADDVTVKSGGIQYYVAKNLDESGSFLSFKGHLVTKANAKKLAESTTSVKLKVEELVERRIPCSKIHRVDNLNYRAKSASSKSSGDKFVVAQ